MRSRFIDRALALAIAIIISVYVTAQSSATTQNNNESDWEEKFRAIPQAERIKEYLRKLSAEPHHIGSAADKRNAEWIRDQMKTWGLDVTIEEFDVLFPTPKERILDWNIRTIYNVVARITGSDYPDEWIIRGNHHDAWVNGASDPVSGMAVVMEEARAFGEMLKQGWGPNARSSFARGTAKRPVC